MIHLSNRSNCNIDHHQNVMMILANCFSSVEVVSLEKYRTVQLQRRGFESYCL